jgi:dolichol-phosphate mannosyltransferase
MFCPLRADVAQLVEQRFRKPQVTGSNPVVGSAFAMTDLFRPPHSVSIIVPTLNEEENIAALVAQINECAVPFLEILFVDDHSTDATREKVRALQGNRPIRLIEQDGADIGLASAIMSGARAAQGEILLVMDADLSHPPERIKDLLAPLFAGSGDLVVGSRYVKGGSTPGWPMWRRIMSRTGAALAYPLTGLHDSMCGFFAIGRSRLIELAPHTSGFKIVFETIVRGGGTLRVQEIPIAFRDRARGKSKMSFSVALRFFFRWLRAVFQYVVRDTRHCENSEKLARAAEVLHPEAPRK